MFLTHISHGACINSADSHKVMQNEASDQDLQFLLTE